MKKLRYFVVAIALAATLGGPAFVGMASAQIANAAFSGHASSSIVSGQSAKPVAFKPYGPCPTGGTEDC